MTPQLIFTFIVSCLTMGAVMVPFALIAVLFAKKVGLESFTISFDQIIYFICMWIFLDGVRTFMNK